MVASQSDVRIALDRREEIAAALETLRARLAKTKLATQVADLEAEDQRWDGAIREYVLDAYADGEGYEDERVKITRVVGHRRTWNAERLRELVTPRMFKTVTSVVVLSEKINEMVNAGKLDLDTIGDAWEETPNKPYPKWTYKAQGNRASEAESLAEKLA